MAAAGRRRAAVGGKRFFMRDELLDYYERELTFLRQMGRSSQRSTPRSPRACKSSRTVAKTRTSSA